MAAASSDLMKPRSLVMHQRHEILVGVSLRREHASLRRRVGVGRGAEGWRIGMVGWCGGGRMLVETLRTNGSY